KSEQCSKLQVTSVSALIAEAIHAIHNNASVSRLFY
ncbi:MAG: phosphoribosylpyrophosphate synthetase, partial [Deltaproteobacteria bacterium]|nr:phosphoribosylpyrophosphate synthetase [Deltaproteobacteria bacterium]